ncbi:hypothetical protein DFQ29_008644 [Apophysomyces sp. BC1021]|nr:hypothetical protein DFQ29_008644 [Apophysomyces sp. BC1021]
MDHINYLSTVVPVSDSNTRIKKWLLVHYRHVVKSKECVRRSFQRKEISVNGKVAEETRILVAGDVVEVRYDKSLEEQQRLKRIDIDIRFQDEHLAIVWKPAGQNFGLFERALQYTLQNDENERIWCIYTLQKAASGLLLIAKTAEARQALLQTYEAGEMDLQMRIMCHGHVPPDLLASLPSTVASSLPAELDAEDDEEMEPIKAEPARLVRHIDIVSVTRSNNADYITTLDLDISTPLSTPIQVQGVEPDKFELLRQREQKFWRRKVEQELEEMRKAGVEVDDAKNIDTLEMSDRKKKPLAYILGEKEFCGLRFKVTESCLIPRPSSETLVHATVAACPRRILDIGTGSGNLLISILMQLPKAVGVGIDISEDALGVARQNAARLGVADRCTFVLKDMAQLGSTELYDVVVCNPPYLNLDYISKQKEQMKMLEHEPQKALFANEQGYEWYTVLSKIVPLVIHPHGRVVLECGKGMIERVKVIWSGWKVVEIRTDAQGFQRCLVLEME